MIIFSVHPKTGTNICDKIATALCTTLGWEKNAGILDERILAQDPPVDVWVHILSNFDYDKLGIDYRGIHMIRDPRSIIVSGYNHTLLQIERGFMPDDNPFRHLDQVSIEEGLISYLEEYAVDNLMWMYNWNYQNPRILELKYEEMMDDYPGTWKKIFQYLGIDLKYLYLTDDENIHKMSNETKKKLNHITNFQVDLNIWKQYFTPKVIAKFKELIPSDIFEKLGYEPFEN